MGAHESHPPADVGVLQRFGVEGCEALLPGVDALVGRCAAAGVRRIEVGMAHRGRLSLLCNLLHKPPGALFAQMENGQSDYRVGDVKYHLGDTATLAFGGVTPCNRMRAVHLFTMLTLAA